MRIYAKGDRVVQSQYGAGTIEETSERHTVINFDEYGLKTLSTRLVMLVRTAVAPPIANRRSGSAHGPRVRRSRGPEQR